MSISDRGKPLVAINASNGNQSHIGITPNTTTESLLADLGFDPSLHRLTAIHGRRRLFPGEDVHAAIVPNQKLAITPEIKFGN